MSERDAFDPPDSFGADSFEPDAPAALAGRSNWDALALLVLFVGGQNLGERLTGEDTGLHWAIGLVTAYGIYAIFRRWRAGAPIGKFLPIILVFLVARGTAGIVFASTDVYFGIGIAAKVSFGLAMAGSVLIGRPLAAIGLPYLFPFDEKTQAHPIYGSTMAHLTWMGSAFYLFTSVWDVWLLTNTTANGYVVIRFIVGMFVGVGVFFVAFFYARFRLDKIPDFEGLLPMVERMSTEMGRPR